MTEGDTAVTEPTIDHRRRKQQAEKVGGLHLDDDSTDDASFGPGTRRRQKDVRELKSIAGMTDLLFSVV